MVHDHLHYGTGDYYIYTFLLQNGESHFIENAAG